MYLSQIVEFGDRDQIFAAPRHPYTKALMAAHLSTPTRRIAVPSIPPRLSGWRARSRARSGPAAAGCFLAGRCPVGLAALS